MSGLVGTWDQCSYTLILQGLGWENKLDNEEKGQIPEHRQSLSHCLKDSRQKSVKSLLQFQRQTHTLSLLKGNDDCVLEMFSGHRFPFIFGMQNQTERMMHLECIRLKQRTDN